MYIYIYSIRIVRLIEGSTRNLNNNSYNYVGLRGCLGQVQRDVGVCRGHMEG